MAESFLLDDQFVTDQQTPETADQQADNGFIADTPPDNAAITETEGEDPRKPKQPSADDLVRSSMVRAFSHDKFVQSPWLSSKVQPYENVRKFMDMPYGYTYGLDNDNFYGEQEGAFKTFGKGVARLGLGIVTKVGQGAGFLLGLANPTNWNEDIISNAADNGLTNLFDQLDEKTKQDWLPTFQEAADREKGFWNRFFTDGDFWMTDAVDGAAFLVSAWVPGMALSKLNLGTKLARGLSGLRVGVTEAEAAVQGAAAAQNYLSKANSLFKTRVDKFNAWALATAGEAMFEASSVKDNVMKSLSEDEFGRVIYNPETGLPYTEEEKKSIAAGAAQNTFLLNTAILGITNTIELRWLGSIFNAGEKAAVSGITGAASLTEKMGVDQATTALGRFMNNSAKGAFIKGLPTNIISEGFVEENAQLAIQRVNERYGAQGKVAGIRDIGEFFNQYGKQTMDALSGNDKEVAESIGLGGILGVIGGGAANISQYNANQAFTAQIVDAYNQAQENWLKFGNVYKTREVFTVDASGNTVKSQQIVLDQNGKPVVDADKLAGVMSGFNAANDALNESAKVQNQFQKDLLRDSAFAQFVIAHVNAGIENTLLDKLDAARKANPEDLAKLGFVAGEDLDNQISRYKSLAASIIKQNKLINSDILVDDSKEDRARKNYMIQLAAEQAVYKNLLGQEQASIDQIKNDLINSENSSLSDGLVDQLNELQQRINSQQQVMDEIGKDPEASSRAKIAKQVMDELQASMKQLQESNQTTLQTLKKDKNGFYQYEKPGRNQPGISAQYNKKTKLKGELQNQIRTSGLEWAEYADTKNGKANFMSMFTQEVVEPFQQAAEQAAAQANETQTAPGKTITLTHTLEDGTQATLDITEGKIYIGKLSQSQRFRGKKVVNTFNNDKIKIISVSEDGQEITIAANGEVISLSAQELAEIAIPEKWVAFDSLSADQKLYLSLRNFEIQYRIIERDASGKMIKDAKGKYRTRIVKGRVTLSKDKKDLLFTYINPATGKKATTDFNMKYVVNKQSLEKLLTTEQAAVLSQEAKVKEKYENQKQYLSNLITETESKLADAQARRTSNDQEFSKLEKELANLKQMLEEALDYLQKNPYVRGRKSNALKTIEQMATDLKAEIAVKEQRLAQLQKEQEDLKTLLESLTSVNEQYYQGLVELEESGSSFLADETGTIYGEEQQQLETARQNQVTKRFSAGQLESMISDTQAELDLVDERVKFLQDHIDQLRKLLNKVLVYKDVADALINITDREQLRNALKLIEDQLAIAPVNTEVLDLAGVPVPEGAVEKATKAADEGIKLALVKALRKGLARGDKGIETQYVLELIERYKEAIAETDELIRRRDELAPKLIRLETALDQKNLLSSLQDRVDFLKTIQEGLLAQYSIANAERIAQRQAKAAEVIQDQLNANKAADEEATNEGETYNYDTKKPLLSVTGIFTTAGRHFIDDADTQLNMENNNAMFYKFSSLVNLLDDQYFLLPVTAQNDQFGIRREDVYADDIKLIVVKKVGSEYKYVDVNGNVLDNPTKDTIIYTSMHGNATLFGTDLNAAVTAVKNNFTTKGLTDAEVLEHIKRFKAFREKIKAEISQGRPAYIPVTGKSKGVQVYVEKDASGLPQELPLEGRLISENTTDFKAMSHPDGQQVKLVVATVKDNTAVDLKPGRIGLQKEDGTLFRVFNRQLSEEEKDNLINVLKSLTGLMARKNSTTSPLSKQEALDLDDIITYLNGIVFWTKPNSGLTSANRFYVDTTTGMLYRGDTAVAFTADSIAAAKELLTKDLYHQVNNTLLKSNNAFFQIVVDNSGKITKNEYQNYTHYLLGQKDKQGKERQLGTAAVYTNTPAYSPDDLTPQLKSVYLTYQDPENPIIPKVTVQQNNTQFPGQPAQPNGQPVVGTAANGFMINPGAVLRPQQGAGQDTRTALVNLKNQILSTADVTPLMDQVFKLLDEKKYEAFQDGFSQAQILSELEGQLRSATTELQVANIITKYLLPKFIDQELSTLPVNQGPVTNAQQNPFVINPGAFTAQPQAQQPAAIGMNPAFVINPNAQAAPQTTTQAPANPFVVNPASPQPLSTPIAPTPQSAAPGQNSIMSMILSSQYQSAMPGNVVDPKIQNLYRLALDKLSKTEDFKKVKAWFEKNLPQVPVSQLPHLIDGIAWGAFKNGAVYLAENAEAGTGFHEAFEAVWNSYVSDEQQQALAAAFRSQQGEFTNPFSQQTKPYSQASMYDVREMLAEGMRDYMLERETYSGKILTFFKELWNAIKSLVGLGEKISEADQLINDLYKSINKGKYVNALPVRDVNALGAVYSRAIPETSQEFSTLVTEGMTGFFFMNLYADQKNIDSLIDQYANTHLLLKDLFVKSLEDLKNYFIGPASEFGQKYVAPMQQQLGRALNQAELDELYKFYMTQNRLAQQIYTVFAYPKEVYDNLKGSLRKFGLEFKEITDEETENLIQDKENTVTDALGIRDAIFIDPRRLTAVNFKLLLGSLTQDKYDPAAVSDTNPGGIVFEKNSIGLPKLVDFDSVHNMLLNELNGTVSRVQDGKFIDALTGMINKLDQKYKKPDGRYKEGYVWIERLKRRLKVTAAEGSYFSTANISADDITLMIGFERSLMNKQNLPVKTIVAENGYIYDTDPIQTSNANLIREKWENMVMRTVQPLSRKSPAALLGVNDKGLIVIDRNSYAYRGNPSDTTKAYISMARPTFSQVIEILGELGIQFSASTEELKKNKVVINQAFSAIREKISDGTINTMQDLFGTNIVNKAISDLVDIEASFVPEDNVLMHYTADGMPQYSITLPSTSTYVLSSLNSARNLADFVASNPQVGTVNPDGSVVLHPYQQRSLLLKQGGLIFDESGKKRAGSELYYHLISGMSDSESDGTNTADLTYPDRVMQEIHYLLKNIHYTIINSDKSTEFGIGMSQPFVTYRQASSDINAADFQAVINIYTDQLEDEIDAAIREQELPSNIQYYSKQVKQLGHFREILGEKLLKEFTSKVLPGKMSKQAFINKPEISDAIRAHITALTAETLQGLIDLDIIKATEVGKTVNNKPVYEYSTKAISAEVLRSFNLSAEQMNQASVDSLVAYLAINKEIAVTEQHKLLYGHPVMYKDLAKRANGVNSTKDAIVDNHEVIKWMDNNMPRLDGKLRAHSTLQTFKTVSYQDVTAVSEFYKEIAEGMFASLTQDMSKENAEKRIGARFDAKGKFKSFIREKNSKGELAFTGELKPYLELNEADGQGWIMPDFYRDMLYLSAKFSKEQLRQWEFEKAYEIVARSAKRKDHPAYKKYKAEVLANAKQVLEQGNPGAVMNVLKPQYFGYANNKSLMQTVFLKHSVQPKFYRQVEGTQYENLYVGAQNAQVDIIGVESGEKVGNMLNSKGEFVPMYDTSGQVNVKVSYKDNGNLDTTTLPDDMPVQELFTRYYGIQQEVPSESKSKVVRGTQVTKLVMSNFYENGKPITPKAGELITEYNDVLRKLISKGKQELLQEMGIESLQDGSYVVTDISKTVTLLRAELEKRDLPNNMLDALQISEDNTTLLYKFDTIANRRKIDNILNSIVDSRVISDKMFGKAAVQVASTGFEATNRQMVFLNDEGVYEEVGDNDVTGKSVVSVSNELKFYRNEQGGIKNMEVYVTWFFDNVDPEDLGFVFKNGVYQVPAGFDPRLLQAVGFRIPTQGMNSIESITIKGFLPREMGDTVIVPSEIVGKSGSDFDIDKLNIYLSNYEAVYSRFTAEQIGEFKDSPFYRILPKSVKTSVESLSDDQFKDYLDDLNNFSVSSGKGKFGNLSEYIKSNNIAPAQADIMTQVKEALVEYNQYRFRARKINQENRKNFRPVIESVQYTESTQDTKKSLQNRFKEIMQQLITLPENYRQLTTPNGAATLKALATDIAGLKGKQDAESSFLALRKFILMAEVRQRYIVGKAMVGIAALQTTSHTMSQVAGVRLSGTYDAKSLYYLFENERNREIIVRLKHNRNENGELYLYAKKDQSGRWISELLSEALTGFVDAAKDPFVFELNLSLGTAGTWFYLQKLGVPVQDIAYLYNQPIVEQYMKEDAKNRTYFKKTNGENLNKFMVMMKVAAPYMEMVPSLKGTYQQILDGLAKIEAVENNAGIDYRSKNTVIISIRKQIKSLRQKVAVELASIRQDSDTLGTSVLRSAIEKYYTKDNKITEKDARLQLGILVDYLEYSAQGQLLSEFIRSIGYDNTRTKTVIENELQRSRWEKMLESGFIANPDAILDNTFLGEMKKQKEDLPNLFKNFFVSLHPKAQPVFEPLRRQLNNRDIFMSADAQSELINKYQNFFISYVIQTTPFVNKGLQTTLNAQYESLMKGALSMGKQLKFLREVNDPNITENPVVKELLPILTSDATQVDNIKLFKNRMDTYKSNILSESIENLHTYATSTGNTALQKFVEDLSVFAILQSGLQEGSLNYSKVLPVHLYTKLVNDIMTNFTEGSAEINPQLVWRQFHQNFWRNANITPKAKFAKKDRLTGNLKLSLSFGDAQFDYVTRTTIRPDISGRANEQRRAELLKQKRYNEIFETILYEKIESGVDMGDDITAVFRPIGKLGDGYKFTEVYAQDRQSIIPQNNNIDPVTGAVVATHIPQDQLTVVTPGSAVAAPVVNQNPAFIINTGGSPVVSMPSNLTLNMNAQPAAPSVDSKRQQVEAIVTAPGYVKDSAKKHLSKELFKIRQATQFIGTGGGNDSTTQRMENAYSQVGLANTGNYTSSDLIYVSSNGNRGQRFVNVNNGQLQGAYQNIDKAIAARVRFIMDTKAHLDATSGYNVGEVAMANYLASKGYTREDATGIWSSAGQQAPASQTDDQIRNSAAYKTWAAANANPMMTDQENFEYYKKCKS